MKVLFVSNASWEPPKGGSTRSNRVWAQQLEMQGHEVKVYAPGAYEPYEPARAPQLLRELISAWKPDWVLVSTEDLRQQLLKAALEAAPTRTVYLAHTPQMFPFGPASLAPNPLGAELVRRCAARIAICQFTADYIARYAGEPAVIVHPPIYGRPPWERLGAFDAPYVTLINACAVKGISIFLEVARRLPQVRFAALVGWGTTEADRRALAAQPNVTILTPVERIEDLLAQTRLLLAPSLWPEGFGLVVMEAMLRGVPVVASDAGGLVEAKQGTSYLIPVRLIERYEVRFDEHRLPAPIIPPQEIEPWVGAVARLTTDQAEWQRAAAEAYEAGVRFVNSIEPDGLERVLMNLKPREAREAGAPAAASELTAERRALLLKLARERRR